MTAADAVNRASSTLAAAGFDDSAWQAKVLVAHSLSIKPEQLYLIGDNPFKHVDERKLASLLEARLSGIPLQHVTGDWDFYGRTYKVDSRALIPRPETELLVDCVVSANLPPEPLVADVGTGSGVIGISLALEIPDSAVEGTDISAGALELAR